MPAKSGSRGEPYVNHPVAVATILADLQMDATTLVAAILHDVVEDTGVTLEAGPGGIRGDGQQAWSMASPS